MARKEYIHVGPCKFEVKEVERLQDDGEVLCGDMNWAKQLIRIDAGQHPNAKFLTRWHEVVHAILLNAGRTEGDDESLVEILSQGIGQVLIDNPQMRR